MNTGIHSDPAEEVAIIGMAVRLPKARTLDEFWSNLRAGRECISFFSEEELVAARVDRKTILRPDYVRAKAILEEAEFFDAAFFDCAAREAEVADPQFRVFLECAHEALENAACVPGTGHEAIGIYAGMSDSNYAAHAGRGFREAVQNTGISKAVLANSKDFLATWVSYKLNLKGPSVTVQTACSTSLVAVHLACQALLNGECDIALAGGVAIRFPQQAGYLYSEGGIGSPDGHCRPFDAEARGTVAGNGAGVVVLRRLSSARSVRDNIRAVIKGSAVNNDGSRKVGFTAPSIDGQSEVIAEALSAAGIDPSTLSYIEAHGTGTPLGDPIEVAALSKALQSSGALPDRLTIGTVKSNIGHLDAAAGVAGLIKTVLAIENRELPPSLHFQKPNPKIDFVGSGFGVQTVRESWRPASGVLRAGVSSFGIGGTNAHVVLEQAPAETPPGPSRDFQLLVLSAKTPTALDFMKRNLAGWLRNHPEESIADAAYTLQCGRREFAHRHAFVAASVEDALAALSEPETALLSGTHLNHTKTVAFLFPGQGTQFAGMGAKLYREEPVFREAIDRCAEGLTPHLKTDLRQFLWRRDGAEDHLRETIAAQPSLFAVEYALATLLMSWGIRPDAMLGHSIGEWVAACIAGVFSLEDALRLVAIRATLMQQAPRGAMIVVPLGEADVQRYLDRVCLAAVNARDRCVLSGPEADVEALERELVRDGVAVRILRTSHAFHSRMMAPAAKAFAQVIREVKLQMPRVPFLSNVTGTWIGDEATDPNYWASHLRRTVRFADALAELAPRGHVLVEAGPGQSLSSLVKHSAVSANPRVYATMRNGKDVPGEMFSLLQALGGIWSAGVPVDWQAFSAHEIRRRRPLPSYPFERSRYFPEAQSARDDASSAPSPAPHQLRGEGNDELGRLLEEQLQLMGLQISALAEIYAPGLTSEPLS